MSSVGHRRSLAEMLRDQHQTDAKPDTRLFREEPVWLDTFVQDKKFLGNPKLYPFQYEAVRQMELVYTLDTRILMVEEFGEQWLPLVQAPMRNFIYLMVGKGSGKDHMVRIGSSRVAYLVSCLAEPQAYYRMAPQDFIHTINVATTAPQAMRAFFDPLKLLVKSSPWFKKHLANDITPKATEIALDTQFVMVSGHSLAESFEGLNPIVAVADEIAGFRAAAEIMQRQGQLREGQGSAEQIMKVLRSSARSRYTLKHDDDTEEALFKVCALSYTRYLGDPIMNLVAQGNRDIEVKGAEKSRYYVLGPKATWDVNPKIKGPESFQEDYNEDPEQAAATYECKPQRSSNRFFRNDYAVLTSLPDRQDERQPIDIEYYWGPNDREDTLPGEQPTWSWQVRFHFHPDLRAYEGALYAIHGDMALSQDRAGVCLAHVRTWQRAEDTTAAREDEQAQEDRPVVRVDFVGSFEADIIAETPDGELVAREIQQRWLRKLARALIERGFTVARVTLDGWNSVDSIQIFQAWGIEAKKLSVDTSAGPYQTLKDVMYDGRLEGYDDGIVRTEIEGLTKLRNGKIDHPANGSKDEADALCGAVVGALTLGGSEGEIGEEVTEAIFGGAIDLEVSAGMGSLSGRDLGLASSWSDIQMSDNWA